MDNTLDNLDGDNIFDDLGVLESSEVAIDEGIELLFADQIKLGRLYLDIALRENMN